MTNTTVVLKETLKILFREGQRWRRNDAELQERQIINDVLNTHTSITDESHICHAFDGNNSVAEIDAAIVLQGIRADLPMIPFLWFHYDSREGLRGRRQRGRGRRAGGGAQHGRILDVGPELRLRIGLFFSADGDQVRSVGYRVETSEGPGPHDYCHVQPITQVNGTGGLLHGVYSPISTKIPTVPLAASTPNDLLGCAMVMLYGPDMLKQLNVMLGYGDVWSALYKRLTPSAEGGQ